MIEIYQKNDVLLKINVNDLSGIERANFKLSNGNECLIDVDVNIDNDVVKIYLSADDTNINSGYYNIECTVYDVEEKEYTILQSKLKIIERLCLNG